MKRKSVGVLIYLEAACLGAAVLFYFVSLPADWVERVYSNRLYPNLQSCLTWFSNLFPFALTDLLLCGAVVLLLSWWVLRLRSAPSGIRRRTAARLLLHTAAFAAAIYLLFLALWGFNYQRVPLSSTLDYDDARVTREALTHLRRTVIERVNSAADSRNIDWPSEEQWQANLRESLYQVLRDAGGSGRLRPGLPKKSILDFYLRAAGVSGFTSPFAHEVILDSTLLSFERPSILAHEWAHLAGYANESEASFIGVLACAQSPQPSLRYSGWLELYRLIISDKPESGTQTGLRPEVIADLEAIEQRISSNASRGISQAQSEVYDRFLKANRVEEGIASYGLVVRLLLGTRLDADWAPATKREQ